MIKIQKNFRFRFSTGTLEFKNSQDVLSTRFQPLIFFIFEVGNRYNTS
jgi:hypothetical protein